MKILFDNNAFAYLTQQPERVKDLRKLEELVECGKVEVVGTLMLVEELAGRAETNIGQYMTTLSQYRELTKGKILKPWNELIKMEVKFQRPIDFQNSIYEGDAVKEFFNRLNNATEAIVLYNEVRTQQESYKQSMDEAFNSFFTELGVADNHTAEIEVEAEKWFKEFDKHAQDFFLYMCKGKTTISYRELPHVSAYLNYFHTRRYERIIFSKSDRATDLHDMGYFVDAAVVDTLVTNDKLFINTCRRVTHRDFEVKKLNELILRINQMRVE